MIKFYHPQKIYQQLFSHFWGTDRNIAHIPMAKLKDWVVLGTATTPVRSATSVTGGPVSVVEAVCQALRLD